METDIRHVRINLEGNRKAREDQKQTVTAPKWPSTTRHHILNTERRHTKNGKINSPTT